MMSKGGYEPIVHEPNSTRRVRFSKPEADYLPIPSSAPDDDPELGEYDCDESTKRSITELEMKIKNDIIVKQLICGLCCFAVWAVLVVGFLVIAPSFF